MNPGNTFPGEFDFSSCDPLFSVFENSHWNGKMENNEEAPKIQQGVQNEFVVKVEPIDTTFQHFGWDSEKSSEKPQPSSDNISRKRRRGTSSSSDDYTAIKEEAPQPTGRPLFDIAAQESNIVAANPQIAERLMLPSILLRGRPPMRLDWDTTTRTTTSTTTARTRTTTATTTRTTRTKRTRTTAPKVEIGNDVTQEAAQMFTNCLQNAIMNPLALLESLMKPT